MQSNAMILLFVKAPARGRVKTRIASVLDDDIALELYRSFVLDMLQTVDKTGVPSMICYHPSEAADEVMNWLGRERSYLVQRGSDVGERMEYAFREAFSRGCTRAVLIGSDIPDLPGSILNNALDALADFEAVIGPAADGGYYLIGFRNDSFLSEVFKGIAWSTNQVFRITRAIFNRAGRTVHQLPRWRDVDTVHDLQHLRARNAGTDFQRSRTMTYLATIRKEMLVTEGYHGEV